MNSNLLKLISDYIDELETENKDFKMKINTAEQKIFEIYKTYEGKDNLITNDCKELIRILGRIEADEYE